MAMNRQMKRALQRQGQIDQDGNPAPARQQQRPAPRPKEDRASPAQYLREVRAELRKVAWPTRDEVIKYSVVVLVALVLVTAMILGLDWVFTEAVFFLFD
jgi:preprotein translocase subunit SecE